LKAGYKGYSGELIEELIAMFKKITMFIGALLLSFGVAAQDTLKVGVDANLKPFVYMAESGEIKGFDIDIANEMCVELQKTCQFIPMDWDGLIPSLKTGKIDVIISSMSITDERAKVIDFTENYYDTPTALVVRDDITSLEGEKIGVLRGSVHATYADEVLRKQGIIPVAYANQNEVFLDMLAGRVAGILSSQIEIQFGFLDTPQGKGFSVFGEPMKGQEFGKGIGMGVSKSNPELTAQLNKAIDDIYADGRWKQASDKYFDYDIWGR
jgi:arginine/ornithine transport system substrate-binding protein